MTIACRIAGILAFMAFNTLSPSALAQVDSFACGSLNNHFGPYDYRTAAPEIRLVVESAHFPERVESLRGGNTTVTAGGDLGYTLRVFPNHPRALMAAIKLAEKEKKATPRDMVYSVECYFDRAERFRPDDPTVLALYGTYLVRAGRPQEGTIKLQAALRLAGDDANINYNLGLAFFDLKQYDKALESAQRAYMLGFPLPGLREKLKSVGKWSEPKPESPAPVEKSSP